METIFYIRLPGQTYYDNPYSKDSICFLFDIGKKTLEIEKRSIGDGDFVLSKETVPLEESDIKRLRNILVSHEGFLMKYMKTYIPADGKRFIHSIFSFSGTKVYFPDYLENFKRNDVFKRYRYYPNKKRVLFYAILRSLIYIAFSRSEFPDKECPITNRNAIVLRIHGEATKLE